MATITWADVTQLVKDVCGLPAFVTAAVVAQANLANVCGLVEPVEKLARVYLAAHFATLAQDGANSANSDVAAAVKSYTLGPETVTYADGAGTALANGSGLNSTKWGRLYLLTVKSGQCSPDWIVTRV